MLVEVGDSTGGTTMLITEDAVGLAEVTEVVVEDGTEEMTDIKRSTTEDSLLQLMTTEVMV